VVSSTAVQHDKVNLVLSRCVLRGCSKQLCAQAREHGVLSSEALAQLQSVEATGVLETMAAMDAINGLEPIAAMARGPGGAAGTPDKCAPNAAHQDMLELTSQTAACCYCRLRVGMRCFNQTRICSVPAPRERPKQAQLVACNTARTHRTREAADAAAFLERYAADAESRMRGLGGTGLLERNRAALERALRTRAEHAAKEKRGREDVLAQAKRVERSSVFVPSADASVGALCALACHCALCGSRHVHVLQADVGG
jgi:hypothetical protein